MPAAYGPSDSDLLWRDRPESRHGYRSCRIYHERTNDELLSAPPFCAWPRTPEDDVWCAVCRKQIDWTDLAPCFGAHPQTVHRSGDTDTASYGLFGNTNTKRTRVYESFLNSQQSSCKSVCSLLGCVHVVILFCLSAHVITAAYGHLSEGTWGRSTEDAYIRPRKLRDLDARGHDLPLTELHTIRADTIQQRTTSPV